MAEVLVTGATGTLGSVLVPRLLAAGHSVRALVRSDKPLPDGVRRIPGDVATGEGVPRAVAGAEVVVHAASSPFRRVRETDVEGTRRLVESVGEFNPPHVVYVSIVGVDRHPLPYYRAKRQAEVIVEGSGLPWTVLRATQFHSLLDHLLDRTGRGPVVPVARDFVFQPVDRSEVADRLTEIVDGPPLGLAPDLGGPQVRRLDDLARAWLRAHTRRKPILGVPVPGRIGRAFREGVHTCPDRADATITWEEYLSA